MTRISLSISRRLQVFREAHRGVRKWRESTDREARRKRSRVHRRWVSFLISMCASALDSVRFHIDGLSTDEEIVLFLGARRVGDPIPATVITEVNPFSIEPWNSPENILYLYNPDDTQANKGSNEIKETKAGYWKSMGEVLKISTSSLMMGRKTTREFFIGNPPFSDKTGWMMHEYQAEWKTCQGIGIAQEYSSLCKVFWQSDQRPDHEEQGSSVGLDSTFDADADAEYVEAMLLLLLEEDERNRSVHYDANGTQTVSEEGQRQRASSSKISQEPLPNNTMVDMPANYDFSNEEYIELNDIYHLESSSSNSDISSNAAMDSDDYFDADALLKDLTSDQQTDSRYKISAPVQSNQIIIRPSPSGSIISSDNNREAPKPENSRGNQPNSNVSRIAKLTKRYCCFASF